MPECGEGSCVLEDGHDGFCRWKSDTRNLLVESFQTEAEKLSHAVFAEPGPPEFRVVDDVGRTLLVATIREGQLVAEYDDADLDEAARRFVDAVRRLWVGDA